MPRNYNYRTQTWGKAGDQQAAVSGGVQGVRLGTGCCGDSEAGELGPSCQTTPGTIATVIGGMQSCAPPGFWGPALWAGKVVMTGPDIPRTCAACQWSLESPLA